MQSTADTPIHTIPLTIITGFLGSGKTSFLSRLLSRRTGAEFAVIINEFGEHSLDHLLVDYISDQTFELPNGCLCCSARSEMVDKMTELAQGNQSGELDFNHLIIETSGISDPVNLIENILSNHQLRQSFRLTNLITLVSALEWQGNQSGFVEVSRQLSMSDTIVISKSDLLPQKTRSRDLAHLFTQIEQINPNANICILPLSAGELENILDSQPLSLNDSSFLPTGSEHKITCGTFTLSHNSPLPVATIESFLETLLARHDDRILRVKGLVFTMENPDQPLVIQSVGSTISPLSWLDTWNITAQTRLTVIHTGEIKENIRALFDSFLNLPALDQPDKSAITDNPLSITGIGKFKSQ